MDKAGIWNKKHDQTILTCYLSVKLVWLYWEDQLNILAAVKKGLPVANTEVMDEDLWEEIGVLRSELDDLKAVCANIQEYFKYLSDPIGTTQFGNRGDQALNTNTKVSDIFKSVCQNASKLKKKILHTEILVLSKVMITMGL